MLMLRPAWIVVMTVVAMALLGCADADRETATLVDAAALAEQGSGDNWLAYGRNFSEQRYSPLAQVNEENVSGLGVAWFVDLPNDRSLVGTPLVVDGVLYYEGSYNVLRAVDATTGELRWEHDPQVIETAGDRLRLFWDYSRGIAFWKGAVYQATMDGRLIAVDARDGSVLWSQMTVDPELPLVITGVPKVFKDKVIIGNGGTEFGPIRGYVTAYDAATGEQAWRWYTVPGNPADGFENEAMAMAAETWTGEWWKYGGGGTVWNGITYDPEFDVVYLGTGNGAPWNRRIRSPDGGDNLFLCSIVALDAETGEYRWHYQTTPGEAWDYNSNMDIVLADLPIGGRQVKALLHAPKNGFFYVIDRETGRLISGEPYARTTWASAIDPGTGRPVEVPGARYEEGGAEIYPSPWGAHSWHAMSYNPETGLVYLPTMDIGAVYSDSGVDIKTWESPDWAFLGTGVELVLDDAETSTSSLKAWDPVEQRAVWEVPLPGVWNAGTLTTAGNLVFQGRADGRLVAYRASDGEVLWRFDLGSGISAPPITYAVDGRQYVSILVGWGAAMPALGTSLSAQHGWAYRVHPRRLVTFALDGEVELPASPPPFFPQPIDAPDFVVDSALAAAGGAIFDGKCSICHGFGAVSGGSAPDLRASPVVPSHEAFVEVVIGGARRPMGMPQFSELSEIQAGALQHYIRAQVPSKP
ncbi:MAG: PQQ-dependent dehydrogenase, methanol/ethanol family [Gemmatimonadota bacterium]|jgi:quinohemoprotein ethanol dehydrogenase|nr:MAG: PQQ-dependent dehydrogenase, methanol/ethanol family [Gemmatimonadota bacterium]